MRVLCVVVYAAHTGAGMRVVADGRKQRIRARSGPSRSAQDTPLYSSQSYCSSIEYYTGDVTHSYSR